jgi:hypothetical protein
VLADPTGDLATMSAANGRRFDGRAHGGLVFVGFYGRSSRQLRRVRPFLAQRKRKQGFPLTSLVGVAGFEPTGSSSRTVIRVN